MQGEAARGLKRVADVVLVASEGFNCLPPRGTSAVAPPWLYPRDHQFQLETVLWSRLQGWQQTMQDALCKKCTRSIG